MAQLTLSPAGRGILPGEHNTFPPLKRWTPVRDSETHCHCGAAYGGCDHCWHCYCEQYESGDCGETAPHEHYDPTR